VLSISLQNPVEVFLAIVFSITAAVLLLATFGFVIAYVVSNICERWPDYTSAKRMKVCRNVLLAIIAISAIIWMSTSR
jgi:MFS superfamily sulfate permease-like transporter